MQNKFIYCANKESAEFFLKKGAKMLQHNERAQGDFWVFEATPELELAAKTMPQSFISNKLTF